MSPNQLIKEIDKLDLSEKLILVEDIWDSIARSNSELPLPEWQKVELDKRYKEYKSGKPKLHDKQFSFHQITKLKHRVQSECVVSHCVFLFQSPKWAFMTLCKKDHRNAATAKQTQPARKASPPMGVIAPSQRTPEMLRMYKLPEKMTMPAMKSQPAELVSAPGHFVQAQAAASWASA